MIEYEFYRKPVTNKCVMLNTSANSMQQKMATLTQMCFMRLHNTSPDASENTKIRVLDDFMQDLHISGYTENDRKCILKGGINTYKRIKSLELSGTRPFYRPNSYKKVERKIIKKNKKNNWFKGKNSDDKFKSVMFVEATPGDKLLKMMRETEDKYRISNDHRIKFVSKAGTKLVNLVERRNPFEAKCKKNECPVCDNSDKPKTNCMTNNVCYEAKCKTCEQKGKNYHYTGETARNLHKRSKEHVKGLESNKKDNWMVRHIEKEHKDNEKEVKFTWRVLRKHNKALQRQLHEAVAIANKSDEENLNSKYEYFGQRIKRLNLDKKEKVVSCRVCGMDFQSTSSEREHWRKFHENVKCTTCDFMTFGSYALQEHKTSEKCSKNTNL